MYKESMPSPKAVEPKALHLTELNVKLEQATDLINQQQETIAKLKKEMRKIQNRLDQISNVVNKISRQNG